MQAFLSGSGFDNKSPDMTGFATLLICLQYYTVNIAAAQGRLKMCNFCSSECTTEHCLKKDSMHRKFFNVELFLNELERINSIIQHKQTQLCMFSESYCFYVVKRLRGAWRRKKLLLLTFKHRESMQSLYMPRGLKMLVFILPKSPGLYYQTDQTIIQRKAK